MQRILAALGLFVGAPLIAEFLFGNFSITMIGALIVLAPMYGGSALLIRETVRRAGRGWPSILFLALAYGILEEGLIMQSLFNPNFLGLNQHLLQPAYLPALGMGAWWTVFVLTLHTVWSIPVSIALAEALAPRWAGGPWLKGRGLTLTAIVFLLGCFSIARFTVRKDPAHFVASPVQIAGAVLAIAALIALALRPPRPSRVSSGRTVPPYAVTGLLALLAGSAFLIIPNQWGWWAVALYLILDGGMMVTIRLWSRRAGWGAGHRLALVGGAALAYAWHAFLAVPAVGATNRVGNGVFAAGLLVVLWVAATQIRPVSRLGAA